MQLSELQIGDVVHYYTELEHVIVNICVDTGVVATLTLSPTGAFGFGSPRDLKFVRRVTLEELVTSTNMSLREFGLKLKEQNAK